jgi:hypothetical protein
MELADPARPFGRAVRPRSGSRIDSRRGGLLGQARGSSAPHTAAARDPMQVRPAQRAASALFIRCSSAQRRASVSCSNAFAARRLPIHEDDDGDVLRVRHQARLHDVLAAL